MKFTAVNRISLKFLGHERITVLNYVILRNMFWAHKVSRGIKTRELRPNIIYIFFYFRDKINDIRESFPYHY